MGNESPADYIIRTGMANDKTWATETEIFAAPQFLKTDIYVYSLTNDSQQ